MNLRNLIAGVALAAAASAALGAPAGMTDTPADTDIFGRPIVHNDEVQELYREEPWVNPLPEFWGFEHPKAAAAPAVTPRETGVQIEQENE